MTPGKRYRILKYPWHTAHDYELAKLPHEFYFLTDTHREWATRHRPIPANVRWVGSPHQVATDVMILHIDQWAYHEPSKRYLFLTKKQSYAGPKIVINHGCNMVDGCSSEVMARLVEGCFVVCNSSTAHRLWGIPNSRFIRHGMDPDEWPPTTYAHSSILMVQEYGKLHREFRNYAGVERAERYVKMTWVGRDVQFDSFEKYRRFLQSSSVFFQPSYASPNPRARTEAMLTGLAVVTTNSHGEDEYIENGVNGFCSNNFGELIEFLVYLEQNPDQARAIGQRGRATAQRVFHIENFIAAWDDLLRDYLG